MTGPYMRKVGSQISDDDYVVTGDEGRMAVVVEPIAQGQTIIGGYEAGLQMIDQDGIVTGQTVFGHPLELQIQSFKSFKDGK